MNELPPTPNNARYQYCYECHTMTEYDVTKMMGASHLKGAEGLPASFVVIPCQCGMVYSVDKESTPTTPTQAFKQLIQLLKSQNDHLNKKYSEVRASIDPIDTGYAKAMLWDQCKELKDAHTAIQAEEYEEACNILQNQITFLNDTYGSPISEDMSSDHIAIMEEVKADDNNGQEDLQEGVDQDLLNYFLDEGNEEDNGTT